MTRCTLPRPWPARVCCRPPVDLARRIDATIQETVAQHGLTVTEHDVLAALRRQGDPFWLTPTQLKRALLLSSGGTSNVLRQLAP